MLIPFAALTIVPAQLDGPTSWVSLVSLILGLLSLSGAVWKAARGLWSLTQTVKQLADDLEQEIERRKQAEEDAKKERKEQAAQFVEIRRQIDRILIRNEVEEEFKEKTGELPIPRIGAPKSPGGKR